MKVTVSVPFVFHFIGNFLPSCSVPWVMPNFFSYSCHTLGENGKRSCAWSQMVSGMNSNMQAGMPMKATLDFLALSERATSIKYLSSCVGS